jgi:hypothetical protein
MLIRILLGLVTAVAAVPAFAAAQNPQTPEQQLQLEKRLQRVIVRPRVAPDVVTQDADQVAAEIEREGRRERMLREASMPLRRPDLDRDVAEGIQSRALNTRGR